MCNWPSHPGTPLLTFFYTCLISNFQTLPSVLTVQWQPCFLFPWEKRSPQEWIFHICFYTTVARFLQLTFPHHAMNRSSVLPSKAAPPPSIPSLSFSPHHVCCSSNCLLTAASPDFPSPLNRYPRHTASCHLPSLKRTFKNHSPDHTVSSSSHPISLFFMITKVCQEVLYFFCTQFLFSHTFLGPIQTFIPTTSLKLHLWRSTKIVSSM